VNHSLASMPNETIFLDANVLLEIILGREKQAIAKSFIETNSKNLYISALTAHLVIHFGTSIVELPVLRQFLGDYSILPLEATDFEWAFTNILNNDYEDALQLAVAIRQGCNRFVTFDKSLIKTYKHLPSIEAILLA
jgi:predicted nucleic acid-binding protein